MRRSRLLFSLSIALVAALGCSTPASREPDRVASSAAPTPAPTPAASPATPPAAEAPTPPATPAFAPPDVAVGKHGAVASAEKAATAAGRAVLEAGGNAIDAAVAIGFALGVTHPTAGNMGGGGFMVIRLPDGKTTTIDFREVAPGKASRDMYLDEKGNVTMDRLLGPRAAGIPGDVAGFAMAHKKFGSRPWKELLQPAIALARDGHEIDSFHADDIADALAEMNEYLKQVEAAPQPNAALAAGLRETIAMFSRPDGSPLQKGDRATEPALAATLEAIASGGPNAFYRGPLARKMATGVKAMGGLWTTADLAGYRAIERKPIEFDYHGYRVTTMPPPSGGGIILRQVLAASETLRLHELPWESVERVHLYVEALRRVYADRNMLVGDPAFIDVPLKKLLDVSYMSKRMADVDREHATPSSKVGAGVQVQEKTQTTHFSVVDGKGMAVSVTYTLNGPFGAHLVIPGTGVLLNNEMDDFTAKVGVANLYGLIQGPQNAIAPGKRMLSSMAPTIVAKDGKVRVLCGSPGGGTIPTTVVQVLLQVLDYGRPLDQAIANTRIHHQWLPDAIIHEATLDPSLAKALAARGHALKVMPRIGHANCIELDPKTGDLRAVADVGRRGGDADAF